MAQSVKFVQKVGQFLHNIIELCYLCTLYGSSKD